MSASSREREAEHGPQRSFTVREMSRNSRAVLDACRQHGRVVIRSRTGERYKMELLPGEEEFPAIHPEFMERLGKHRERIRALGFAGPEGADMERLSRMIAGEE